MSTIPNLENVVSTPVRVRIPKKSLPIKANTFEGFLAKHVASKEDIDNGMIITNTRIPDRENGTFGGRYSIPDNKYDEFLKLYYNEILLGSKNEHLTEKQRVDEGPILLDLDLKFSYETKKRIYTKDHIFDLICTYLDELKQMYQFDETQNIPIFIFEKDMVNRVEDKGYTKDGIHIIIGLQMSHNVQCILRNRIIARIADVWGDIPITNTWDDVFDSSISKGNSNWQLYGSVKPQHEPYKLKYVYILKKDANSEEIEIVEVEDKRQFLTEGGIYQLSARYPQHPSLFMTSAFLIEYNNNEEIIAATLKSSVKYQSDTPFVSESLFTSSGFTMNDILSVRTYEELQNAKTKFILYLESAKPAMKEAYQYAMTLPASYYGDGSFGQWLRVGWALRNTSNDLFVVWVLFSEQANGFKYSSIRDDLYPRWLTFDINNPAGKTVRSLMHWSKQDSNEKYKAIRAEYVSEYIEETTRMLSDSSSETSSDGSKKINTNRGAGDTALACVLHQMFKDEFMCVGIRGKSWYHFKDHRWCTNDSGTSLRIQISGAMRALYTHKCFEQLAIMNELGLEVTKDTKNNNSVVKKFCDIMDIQKRLGQTSDKDKIMTEAREQFYDSDFMRKLDMETHLLCFTNGVIDFKEKIFRDGRPEDYITKCTNTAYVKLDPIAHKEYVDEINDFMAKLFPNKELNTYMWEHLASTLIGTATEQTTNFYIGEGQNGKSILVNLMEKCLGEYKGEVPLSLLLDKRGKVGGATPEVAILRGIRYAVIQEPSKGDKINEGVMKQLTGGDPLQARMLYGDTFSFIPQFKLIMCSNIFPEIKSNDHGTWRRIRIVDFESKFVDKPDPTDLENPYQFPLDRYIKDKFDVWSPVFTAMLVEIAYKLGGSVKDCEKVMSSSNSYRNKQDYFAEFIVDKIEVSPNGAIPKNMAVNIFKEWYNANNGNKHPSPKDVISYIDKKFGKNKNGLWTGIKIRDDISNNGYCNDGELASELTSDITDIDFSEI